MPVAWQRGLLLLTAVALAGATVAAAGTIGFVGPDGAASGAAAGRAEPRGAAADGRRCSAALLVVAADLVGRTLFAPTEVPCGLVTAVIGAPFFIWLLYHRAA